MLAYKTKTYKTTFPLFYTGLHDVLHWGKAIYFNVLENNMLEGEFAYKEENTVVKWNNTHNKEFHNLFSLRNNDSIKQRPLNELDT